MQMGMRMKLKGIFVLAVVGLVVAFVATSCVATDEFAPKQRTQIEKYLSGKEYRVTADSAFVYLAGNKYEIPATDRRQGALVGDRVTFNFEAYIFESNGPKDLPYYTNKQYVAEMLPENLNTEYWHFEPMVATIGAGDILNPLEEAFEGCINGDSLLVFLTSSIAYGSTGMGIVPKDTPVMMILTVEGVETKSE
jgi:hypothetical protein